MIPAGTQLAAGVVVQEGDPEFTNPHDDAWCAENSTEPLTFFPAHSAPLEIIFLSGASALPAEWEGSAVVALHGSWDTTPSVGHQVVRIGLGTTDGEAMPTATTDGAVFARGDLRRSARGRPVGLGVGHERGVPGTADGPGRFSGGRCPLRFERQRIGIHGHRGSRAGCDLSNCANHALTGGCIDAPVWRRCDEIAQQRPKEAPVSVGIEFAITLRWELTGCSGRRSHQGNAFQRAQLRQSDRSTL